MARNGIVLALLVFSIPSCSFAQIVITEVMYNLAEGSDSGREWIEVYNTGAETDLTQWKLVESGKNHKISSVGGMSSLASGAYAVIADNVGKFKTDHPDFSGQVFDSAFSLNNSGESIAITDAQGIAADTVMYTDSLGGNGTGDSLQKLHPADSSLMSGITTPGLGVPPGGLVRTPQKEKTSTSKKAAVSASAPLVIVGVEKREVQPQEMRQVASAAGAVSSIVWFLGVFVIALFGAGGVVLARRARMTEWEIVEETEQTG